MTICDDPNMDDSQTNSSTVVLVPALLGLAETLVAQGCQFVETAVDLNVVDNCRDAIRVLTRAARARPDIGAVWKLMGQACTMVN